MNTEGQIRLIASADLLTEIEYFVEVSLAEDWETKHTVHSALHEISDRAEEGVEGWKVFRAECRKILIVLGEYVEMTQDEIDRTICSHGKAWDFKTGGKAYRLEK